MNAAGKDHRAIAPDCQIVKGRRNSHHVGKPSRNIGLARAQPGSGDNVAQPARDIATGASWKTGACGWARVTQRTVIYLGEINDAEQAASRRTIAVVLEDTQSLQQVSLFPEGRAIPPEVLDGTPDRSLTVAARLRDH